MQETDAEFEYLQGKVAGLKSLSGGLLAALCSISKVERVELLEALTPKLISGAIDKELRFSQGHTHFDQGFLDAFADFANDQIPQ